MRSQTTDYTLECEKTLADGMVAFASDLRLVDLADFVRLIHRDQIAHVTQIIEGSLELFFKAGTVCFGSGGDVDLEWSGPAAVRLDMEFHHGLISAYFDLVLAAEHAAVSLKYIEFPGATALSGEHIRTLAAALHDARL